MALLFLRKIATLVATLIFLATLTFFLLRILPGGPFDRERPMGESARAELSARYELDRPVLAQYGSYLGKAARLDFGPSYLRDGESVRDILAEGIPVTAFLALGALILALGIGLPLGVTAAASPGSGFDRALRLCAVSALSLPSFLTGAVLLYAFSLRLEIFPAAFWGGGAHRVLPLITLSLLPMAQIARLVRASVLENTSADYVRTARAKGLSESSVLWSHALRNSLLPLLTYLGPLLANLFAGTLVVETLFALPGLGSLFVSSVSGRDYPMVMGLTLLYGAILVAANLAAEISYGFVDPRLRLSNEAAR
ncbi:MAG: ABC transporter permease [Proteobacteria bacterium]|nr:MAG: ABC transporter permease [Pseudomonadota bacterium]